MGIHDRDWFHEGRAERDAMPHPTARKKPIPMKVATSPDPVQKDVTSGSFLSGFVWGSMFTACILLLVYLVIR